MITSQLTNRDHTWYLPIATNDRVVANCAG